MLRVIVGLNRKLSRNFHSTGFSINLDGEVYASPDDPETVLERIRELYDLAEEALDQQVERHRAEATLGDRDAEPAGANGHPAAAEPPPARGRPSDPADDQRVTDKQLQYIGGLARRLGLSPARLNARITDLLRRSCGPDELTKWETGLVIDMLTRKDKTVRDYCNDGRLRGVKQRSGHGRSKRWAIPHEALLRFQREGLLSA